MTKILAIDIGAGTQDIVLYDDLYEQMFKLILPSPTLINANKAEKARNANKHIVTSGEIMGGGPFVHAMKKHLKKGLRICMTPLSSRTIDDDQDCVRDMGIEIVNGNEVTELAGRDDFTYIETRDIRYEAFASVASLFDIAFNPEVVCIAVQDHGVAPKGMSDRHFRFKNFKKSIPGSLTDFGTENPDKSYSRMCAAKRILEKEFPSSKHLIMDTKIAAMFGATYGEVYEKAIVADVGNGHTTMATVQNNQIVGLMEHHTSMISPAKIEHYYECMLDGTLKNEEIYDDGGHGCFISKPIGSADKFLVTGPRRNIFKDTSLEATYVDPIGDVMITGCIGLIECAKRKFDL